MTTLKTLKVEQGSAEWHRLRKLCLTPIPGKQSALYFLATTVIGMEPLIPMTIEGHYSLCLFAERATGIPDIDSARVQLIQVPRGFGKSALVTKCRAIQRLLAHDDWSIGIANEKQDLANAFLDQIKLEFMQNEFLQGLFPERIPPDFRKTTWAADRIVIPRKHPRPTSPSVLAAGVGATVTGAHVDEWYVDDPISQNAAENALRGSFSEIEATNRWMHRLEPLLCSPKRDPITVIGTPWWVGDTYHYIEGTEEEPGLWGHGDPLITYTWRIKLPNGKSQTLQLYRRGELAIYRRPAINAEGKSIFPERWTLDELRMIEKQDPSFFQANYMLNPAEGGATLFDLDWLKTFEYDGPRKYVHYRDQQDQLHTQRIRDLTIYISVDPAFSSAKTAARTAIPVVGTNGKEFFLLEDFAERGMGPKDIANQVAMFTTKYRPHTIFIETVVAQRALLEPIKAALLDANLSHMPIIHEIASHGRKSKEMRIYGLEPWFKGGQFYIHPSQTNFKQEYSSFPRGNLRDTLDAVSFQIESGWEKVAGTANRNTGNWKAKEKAYIEKMKANMGKGGGY